MNKNLKPLTFLFFALLLTLVSLQTSIVPPAFASPASAIYNSSPTTHTITDLTVTNPASAYDSNNATSADFTYTAADGSFDVRSFSTLTDPWRIVKVDFKMRYSTTQSSKDDVYRILYYVDPSLTATVLKDWTRDTHSIPVMGCDIWFSRTEPNDGVWSWTDIGNIRIVVEVDRVGGADTPGDFHEYETWVSVHYRAPTLTVDAPPTANAAFTVDINITNMDDLYGWEFNVTYDTSILTATNVQESPYLNSTGPTQFNSTINDSNGWVYAYCALLGDIPGVTGSGVLANITFSIDATGVSNLDLHNGKLAEYSYISKTTYNYPPYHLTEVDDSVTVTAAVPEFPLGAAMEIALVAVVVYVWWKSKRGPKPPTSVHRIS